MTTTTKYNQEMLHAYTVSYAVNALVSEKLYNDIYSIQHVFASRFPNAVWLTPRSALHITLLQLIMPFVDYGGDKDALFEQVYPQYDTVLHNTLRHVSPIEVTFNRIVVSESAIVLVADQQTIDSFNNIRHQIISQVKLLEGTKQLPDIAHTTIARFVDEVPVEEVQKIADSLQFSITQSIEEFRVVRETELPMLNYSVIKSYPLSY